MDFFPACPCCRRHGIVVCFPVFQLVVLNRSVGADVIDAVSFTSGSPANGDGVVTDEAAGGADLWSSGNCSRVRKHRWVGLG